MKSSRRPGHTFGDSGWEWRVDPDEMEGYLRDYFRTDA